ncbi:glycosyltransferase family 4 protein [Cesiribacter sp. SM1]|uniref:glycosyltransferase family 4 protein n=1 Tax=Cesiribacter sp. SM1 TaxID=2861196 RepID=UPI001CD710B2|nr:glycosyltransferase family 4 protein [Cesiribacter sp. SM1]
MRILYLHQYFKTPEEGGAIRSYYVGKALAARGHQVLMLTSWNGPVEKREQIAGMEVHYLPVPYDNAMGFGRRIQAFVQYLWLARQRIDELMPADLVYATSSPLTIGLLALYAHRRYKVPYLFEVRDLWPEAPIQMGAIRNPLLIKSLRALEKQIYLQAAVVVALSPGIADGIKKLHPGAAVHMAPNMADCEFFRPVPKPAALVKAWGLEGKFVVSYTGAAGATNHLEYLLAAAKACQCAQLPVHFLIAAAGSELERLKQEAAALNNLSFMPFGGKEQVRDYLAVSDASYTSFGPQPILQTNSPNKLFDAMAAAKLCVVNTSGWLKELVEQQQCGFYAPGDKPSEFTEKLHPYLQESRLLEQAQANARHTAETMFSRSTVTGGIAALLEGLV